MTWVAHFSGDQERWREFEEAFNNALEKDSSLTATGKLYYLRSSLKCEEALDIVSTEIRCGKDYDTIMKLLQ